MYSISWQRCHEGIESVYTLIAQGKQKVVEEIIGKLGWWIDRQPKAKSHLMAGAGFSTLR